MGVVILESLDENTAFLNQTASFWFFPPSFSDDRVSLPQFASYYRYQIADRPSWYGWLRQMRDTQSVYQLDWYYGTKVAANRTIASGIRLSVLCAGRPQSAEPFYSIYCVNSALRLVETCQRLSVVYMIFFWASNANCDSNASSMVLFSQDLSRMRRPYSQCADRSLGGTTMQRRTPRVRQDRWWPLATVTIRSRASLR